MSVKLIVLKHDLHHIILENLLILQSLLTGSLSILKNIKTELMPEKENTKLNVRKVENILNGL